MKLHTTLISGALVTAVAAEERRPRNSRLRYLKVNKCIIIVMALLYIMPLVDWPL